MAEIQEGKIILSGAGEIANSEWLSAPLIRPEIELDAFVIMPNHLHGIIIKHARRGDPLGRPYRSQVKSNQIIQGDPTDRLYMPQGYPENISVVDRVIHDRATHRVAPTLEPGTIGSIVGQFKSLSTKKIREKEYQGFHWQRNYYEHIIRDRAELDKVQKYILENPLNWSEDQDNPNNFNSM